MAERTAQLLNAQAMNLDVHDVGESRPFPHNCALKLSGMSLL